MNACSEETERAVVTTYYGATEFELGTLTHSAHGSPRKTFSIYHFNRCCPLACGRWRPGIVDVTPLGPWSFEEALPPAGSGFRACRECLRLGHDPSAGSRRPPSELLDVEQMDAERAREEWAPMDVEQDDSARVSVRPPPPRTQAPCAPPPPSAPTPLSHHQSDAPTAGATAAAAASAAAPLVRPPRKSRLPTISHPMPRAASTSCG